MRRNPPDRAHVLSLELRPHSLQGGCVTHLLDARGLRKLDPSALPFSDPAIQFGAGGLFETLRVEAGAAHLFRAHCERMTRSAAIWRIALPGGTERWMEAIAACAADVPAAPAQRLRMTLGVEPADAREPAVLSPAPGAAPGRMFFEAAPLPPEYLGRIAERSRFRLCVFRDFALSSSSPWAGHKSTQYYAHWEALRRARGAGYDEPILLNERGELAETARFNIFWIAGGALHTPRADCGGLPGVFAARVAALAEGLGIEVRRARAKPQELTESEGVCITNSLAEALEAAEIDGRPLPPFFASPLGARLAAAVEADRPARADGILTLRTS